MRRRTLLAGVAAAALAPAQNEETVTAAQVIVRIQEHVGVPWRKETVDTIKSGDPSTRVTGIATTMFATYDVLQRAAAQGRNFVITHEPTFYSHQDRTEQLITANDPVYADKEKFIRDHNMVVFRFHDHWHVRRPDGILEGMTQKLGWQQYQDSTTPNVYRLPETTLESLASTMRKKLGASTMRVTGKRDRKFSKVALAPGAGGSASHLRLLRRDDIEVLAIGEVPEDYKGTNDKVYLLSVIREELWVLQAFVPKQRPSDMVYFVSEDAGTQLATSQRGESVKATATIKTVDVGGKVSKSKTYSFERRW